MTWDGVGPEPAPLFDAEPYRVEEEHLGPAARRSIRQRELLEDGYHPVSGVPLAVGAAPVDDRTAAGLRCGGCARLYSVVIPSGRRFLKCGEVGLTHGPGTDIRAWWPACAKFVQRDDGPREHFDVAAAINAVNEIRATMEAAPPLEETRAHRHFVAPGAGAPPAPAEPERETVAAVGNDASLPARVEDRRAVIDAINEAALAGGGTFTIATVRPLIRRDVDPHQVGATFKKVQSAGYSEVVVDADGHPVTRPSLNAAGRNTARPMYLWRLRETVPSDVALPTKRRSRAGVSA